MFFSEDDYPDFADLPSKALVYYNAKVNTKITLTFTCSILKKKTMKIINYEKEILPTY